MPEEISTIIGYFAAFLNTGSFVPQAYQAWRIRNLLGILLPMYGIFTIGVGFWLFYGYLIGSVPVFIS